MMQVFSAKEKPLQLTLRLQAIPHSMIGLSEWTFFSLMPAVLSSPGQIQAPVPTDPQVESDYINSKLILLFCTDWSLDTSFILKNERFTVKRTMFAKLFGAKHPYQAKLLHKTLERIMWGILKSN